MAVIAIDGEAGSGKSTLAKELSRILGFRRLNTGMIYRGITCFYFDLFPSKDEPTLERIKKLLEKLNVEIKNIDGADHIFVNDKDYTDKIHEKSVDEFTPLVSGFEEVREVVRETQREFARSCNSVVEGRDIGSVVLPNADIKFYVKASLEARAKRRFEQYRASGVEKDINELMKEMQTRDEIDATREHGKMVVAEDAIVIDNSNETLEQTVARCLDFVNSKIQK